MIIDISGTVITPGNLGKDCQGNGVLTENCCCDECDYMLCCLENHSVEECLKCEDKECPRSSSRTGI